jgi:hypothetical protein
MGGADARPRRGALRGALRFLLAVAPVCVTLAIAAAVLRQSPFAEPFVDRTEAELRVALDRALGRAVSPGWLRAETEAALAAGDLDRVTVLVRLGEARGLAPGPDLRARIAALEAERTGLVARSATCLRCMADIADCPSAAMIAACAVPFELTALGDANALRRAGLAAWRGEPVDEVEVSLALAGLAATGALVVTGGASASAKAGATALRVARRTGDLSPALLARVTALARGAVRPDALADWARGRAPLERAVDGARLAALSTLAADLGRVARATSPGEALRLMRHVDSAEDAARLARLSEAAGQATRGTLDALGKSGAFRLLVRLSDLAVTALGVIYAAALQALTLLAGTAGRLLARTVRRLL